MNDSSQLDYEAVSFFSQDFDPFQSMGDIIVIVQTSRARCEINFQCLSPIPARHFVVRSIPF